jgi:methyltransferase (TIGR00027 family)
MIAGKPSATAERVAIARAMHQLRDAPTVFDDPLAVRLVGIEAVRALEARIRPEVAAYFGALRAFLAARSRIAEDELAAACARGVRRYVVLGAGLDTFAYRNPFADVHVIEVDHPATQRWKRERLAAAGIAVPSSLGFVPIDFTTDDLATTLRAAGVGRGDSTFFSWLGVTPYLERDAIQTTLETVAATSGAEGGVVFDYLTPLAALSQTRRAALSQLLTRLESLGEPFRTYLEPADATGLLERLGFMRVTDWSPDDINVRFFAGRLDGLRVGTTGRVVVARC